MINNDDINGNICVTLQCHKKDLHTLFVIVVQNSYYFLLPTQCFSYLNKKGNAFFPPIDRNYQNIN